MKKLLLISSLIFSAGVSAQNGMYLVTEVTKIDALNGVVIFDSLYVTDPNGNTTASSIPDITYTALHESELNIVFNNISSQGYVLISSQGRDSFLDQSQQGVATSYWRYIFTQQ